MEAIIARVRATDWPVETTGEGAYVKFPDGSGGISIHLSPSDTNAPQKVMRILRKHGFAEAEAQAEASADSTRRRILQEHRAKETADLDRAAVEAANRTRQQTSLHRAAGYLVDTARLFDPHVVITTYRVMMTPALAATLLERNSGNRPLRPRHVLSIKNVMLSGEWLETHQGVALASDGSLVDGQHRLAAVQLAEMTLPMVVTCGVDPAAFGVIDTGRLRTGSDTLALRGETVVLQLSAAIKLLYAHDNFPFREWQRNKVTNVEVLAHLDANPDIRDALRLVDKPCKIMGLMNSAATVGMVLIWREWGREHYMVERFWRDLAGGTNLTEGDPRLALRNHVGNRMNKTRRAPMHLAMFLKTFNYWLTDRQVSMMGFRQGETVPSVLGLAEATVEQHHEEQRRENA